MRRTLPDTTRRTVVMSSPRNLLADTFDSFLGSESSLVLVDFWAPWCGPCNSLAPKVAALSHEFAGRVSVAKVNVDQAPELAQRFGIRGIPSLLLFKDGALIDRRVGTQDADRLGGWIGAVLASQSG